MEETKRYTIAYRGLRSGLHDFHFKVDGGLFRAFGSTEIKDGDCDVSVGITVGFGYLAKGAIDGFASAGNDIGDTTPFEVEIRIAYGGRRLRAEKRLINQWSGASIEMRVDSEAR